MPPTPCVARLAGSTDLTVLQDWSAFVVIDHQNLVASIRSANAKLNYPALAAAFRSVCSSTELWSVLAVPAQTDPRIRIIESAGFATEFFVFDEASCSIEKRRKRTNADGEMVATVTEAIVGRHYDAYVIGSGDGNLVLTIARRIRRHRIGSMIATFSVEGSTSDDILTKNTMLVDANIFVGTDVTIQRQTPAARIQAAAA